MKAPAFRQVSPLSELRLSSRLAPRCDSLRFNRYLPVDPLTFSTEGAEAVGMVEAAPGEEELAEAVQAEERAEAAPEGAGGKAALVGAAPEGAEAKVERAALQVAPLAIQTTTRHEQ